MRLTAPIECRHLAASPDGAREISSLTLIGRAADGGSVHLTLQAAAPADLPARIEAGCVERLDGDRYRVSSGNRDWIIAAARSFTHRDVSGPFYAALPPRPVPLAKRLFWRLVLAAAASAPGRRWLARGG